jgi:Ca2+-dependent lipid-binding protein
LEVPLESLDEILRIAVYDEDIINDTLIGDESYKASTLLGKSL